jgi:hypothetical protein
MGTAAAWAAKGGRSPTGAGHAPTARGAQSVRSSPAKFTLWGPLALSAAPASMHGEEVTLVGFLHMTHHGPYLDVGALRQHNAQCIVFPILAPYPDQFGEQGAEVSPQVTLQESARCEALKRKQEARVADLIFFRPTGFSKHRIRNRSWLSLQ